MSLRLLEEIVGQGGHRVLDVGCGEGAIARRLAAAGAEVVGIDPLASAIAVARAADPGSGRVPSFLEASAEALPFEETSFDTVIFFNSLHHIPVDSMDLALSEAGRVLRPGGNLYVQEPRAEGPAYELLRRVEDETGVRAAALDSLARAAEGSFESVQVWETILTIRHADLAALRAHTVSVDPARAAPFDAQHDELSEAFERLGRPAEGGGYEFDQPFRIELLRRRDGAGSTASA
jgi:SAM-dependent methyltransferase